MPERLKVKFLVVIWGARYIEEFARISLPSYLAEGNLPYVAAETDLEILIMTLKENRDKFNEEAAFAKLKSLCSVRYIFIDDLISTGLYGVTLTLALARGIRDSGPEQVNTHFIFMNSDFVLANGSLRSLVGRFRDGDRCVMAPSLRASAESVLPVLAEAADKGNGVISLSSRQLVQLAFDNLHPTVIAKTVTQGVTTCKTHNQIYWQVDKTALLARHHLIFMLAIKPEVPLGSISSYCDYGFVPELVPSGEFIVLNDSDDFFMLELQSAAQEKNLLRGGTSSLDEIASELSLWSTREHRRFAEVDVLFRTGELPPQLTGARSEFARYFVSLNSRMSPTTVDHVDHFFWVMGVQAWASLKHGLHTPGAMVPPELGKQSMPGIPEGVASDPPANSNLTKIVRASISRWYLGMLERARMRVARWPAVPMWHHLWLDGRLVLNWLGDIERPQGQRNLLICGEISALAAHFEQLPDFEVDRNSGRFADAIALATDWTPDGIRYGNILLHMHRANMRKTKIIADFASRRLKDNGKLGIFVEHLRGENDLSNFSFEIAQCIEDILPSDWIGYEVSARFAGGRLKHRLRLVEQKLFGYLWPSSIRRLPHLAAAMILWPMIAALMAANNFRHRNSSNECPPYCSSFLLSLSRTGGLMRPTSTELPS